jgi:hypothetical protein
VAELIGELEALDEPVGDLLVSRLALPTDGALATEFRATLMRQLRFSDGPALLKCYRWVNEGPGRRLRKGGGGSRRSFR